MEGYRKKKKKGYSHLITRKGDLTRPYTWSEEIRGVRYAGRRGRYKLMGPEAYKN